MSLCNPLMTILFLLLLCLWQVSCQTVIGADTQQLSFYKQIIHPKFISEGVATGDVNRDGLTDIMAGAYWFEAPDWKPHEIQHPLEFDYTSEWSNSFLNFSMDVDQDGWIDQIVIGFPGQEAFWYRNPQGKDEHWPQFLIDSSACNESPMMVDIDDDGRNDLVFGNESDNTMYWFRSPATPGETSWEKIAISDTGAAGTNRFSHGLGFGDVNRDGRNDIIIRHGWWEAPVNRRDVPWKFHQGDLGEPSSQMYAYDFDADGDMDIISASAHAYGIWWYESNGNANDPSFKTHLIDSSFSQTHGVAFVDMNGDQLPDLVTGKRFFAHNGKDPGGLEPAVLSWIEMSRGQDQKPSWILHQIDNDSGAGLHVVVEDIDKDGILDILNANKKGVIVFWGRIPEE